MSNLLSTLGACLVALGAGMMAGWWFSTRRTPVVAPPEPEISPEGKPVEALHRHEIQHELMGKVAHALRNPLTGLLMSAELLQEEEEPRQRQKALDRIQEQGRQIKDIIQRIQDATSIEACQYHLELEGLHLGNIVESVIQVQRERADVKSQIIHVDPLPGGHIVGDRHFVVTVLDELVCNAVKFAPKGSTIRVTVSFDEDWGRIRVEDEGPGLAPSEADRLFTRFSPLSPVPTAGESHLGLGLWTCHLMVETLGGELRYEALHPKGSRFEAAFLKAHRVSTKTA